jgi:hypothetical protein
MKAPHAVLVVLAAAVTLTSVAAASSDAAKERVAITSQAAKPTTLQAGPLKRDSGTQTASLPPERVVMRAGQRVSIYDGPATLKGKRGTLVVRYRTEYVDAGNGYHVGTGTWKVVREQNVGSDPLTMRDSRALTPRNARLMAKGRAAPRGLTPSRSSARG